MRAAPLTLTPTNFFDDEESSEKCQHFPVGCNFCGKNEGCHIGYQNLLPCGENK
jgi:hypothetical protein